MLRVDLTPLCFVGPTNDSEVLILLSLQCVKNSEMVFFIFSYSKTMLNEEAVKMAYQIRIHCGLSRRE